RLLAEYVLAGGDEFHRRRMVDRVRRDVGGGIERAPGDGRVEVGEGVLDAVLLGKTRPALGVRLDRGDDVDVAFVLEGECVRTGHAAGAEDHESHGALIPSSRN